MKRAPLFLVLLAGCALRTEAVDGAPAAAVQAATAAPVEEEPAPRWQGPRILAEVSVVAVGDLLMHTNVQHAARNAAAAGVSHEGFPALFESVRRYVADADLAFANLETPVAPKANLGTRSFVFNVSPALLGALVDVGFDVVSFANNHVYDQGRPGFVETLDHLEASELVHVGAGRTCAEARAPRLVEREGVRVAWLGASKLFNADLNAGEDAPCAFRFDREQALAEVRRAREEGADVVLYSIHWGREYVVAPDPPEIADARALVEGGVDVVIGHHPHVVQPVELVETSDGRVGVVAYSLGNFVSNQAWWYRFGVHAPEKARQRDGLMLAFDVVKKDYGPDVPEERRIVTAVGNVRAIPVWTDNSARAVVDRDVEIRVVAVGDALEAAYAALDAAPDAQAREAALRRIELLRTRWRQVAAIVDDAFLPVPPR